MNKGVNGRLNSAFKMLKAAVSDFWLPFLPRSVSFSHLFFKNSKESLTLNQHLHNHSDRDSFSQIVKKRNDKKLTATQRKIQIIKSTIIHQQSHHKKKAKKKIERGIPKTTSNN